MDNGLVAEEQSVNLSDAEKTLLFYIVAFPGPKYISFLRELMKEPCENAKDGNIAVLNYCNHLCDIGKIECICKKASGIASNLYRLSKPLSIAELREISRFAEVHNLWLDEETAGKISSKSYVGVLNSDQSHYYVGQKDYILAMSQGIRQLIAKKKGFFERCYDEKKSLTIAWYWLKILREDDAIFDEEDVAQLPVWFVMQLLDLAFIRGRSIHNELEIVVKNWKRRPVNVMQRMVAEIAALCVWTGRFDLIKEMASTEGTLMVELLNLFSRLGEKSAQKELCDKLMTPSSIESLSSPNYESCYALRLLCLTLFIGANASESQIRDIVFPNTAGRKRTINHDKKAYPCLHDAEAEIIAICHAFLPFKNKNAFYNGYTCDWLKSCLSYIDKKAFNMPSYIGFFLHFHYLLHSDRFKPTHELEKYYNELFSKTSVVIDKGYPTLVGVAASVMSEIADAELLKKYEESVNSGGGVWLLPYTKPEDRWQLSLAALNNALPKRIAKKKAKKPEEALKGTIFWGIKFRRYAWSDSDSKDVYLLDSLSPGFRPAGEEYIQPVSFPELASAKYDACRTPQDASILCKVLSESNYYSRAYDETVIEALFSHPHVAEITGDEYYHSLRFEEVTFVRGELTFDVERDEDGSFVLSVPNWAYDMKEDYLIRLEGKNNYVYYKFDKRQKNMIAAFMNGRTIDVIRVPAVAEKQVRELIGRALPVMNIGGNYGIDCLTRDNSLRQIEGDVLPVVRLLFSDGVLMAFLGVIPYKGAQFSAPVYKEKSADIVEIDGERVCVVREKERESVANAKVRAILNLENRPDTISDAQKKARSNGRHLITESVFSYHNLEDALSVVADLKELGDGVRVEWPKGAPLTLRDVTENFPNFSDFRTERRWFAMRGNFNLDGDKVISIIDMLLLMEKRVGDYVRIGDNEFLRLSKSLQRRLDALKAAGVVRKDSIEVPPAAVPMLATAFEDGDTYALPETMKEAALRMKDEFARKIKIPEGLNAKLRTYQRKGYEWLAHHAACGFGACLADDMGLGKTVQIIALLLKNASEGPSLVIAPASVCGNWRAELAKFAPSLRVSMAWEADVAQSKPFASLGPGDIVIASYGIVVSRSQVFSSREWNGLILDEGQSIKNHVSKRAHAVKTIHSNFRVVATGTPVENRLAELWSIFDFLNPGLLGPSSSFANRFIINDGMASKELKKLVGPFILRRKKSQVLTDLPPKTEIKIPIELEEEERTAYEACRIKALNQLNGKEENRISILAELTRLRRFCCHPSLVFPEMKKSAKLDALRDLLSNLHEAGHRALIFSQFTDYLTIVRDMVQSAGWTCQYLDGTTPIAERGKAVDDFQHGEGDFFLISLKAGGTGLTLTSANYVVLLDPWWNPAVENQAADRVHRIGQTNAVTVYRLITEKTVEEKILELHAEKTRIATDVLDGAGATKLTPEMLMRLFK